MVGHIHFSYSSLRGVQMAASILPILLGEIASLRGRELITSLSILTRLKKEEKERCGHLHAHHPPLSGWGDGHLHSHYSYFKGWGRSSPPFPAEGRGTHRSLRRRTKREEWLPLLFLFLPQVNGEDGHLHYSYSF